MNNLRDYLESWETELLKRCEIFGLDDLYTYLVVMRALEQARAFVEFVENQEKNEGN